MLTATEAKLEQEVLTCLVRKAREFADLIEVLFRDDPEENSEKASRPCALDAIQASRSLWEWAVEDIQKDFERKRACQGTDLRPLEAVDRDGS